MITKRVILSLCLNEGELTRTKWFRPDRWYPLSHVDLELADEIVLLDVTRPSHSPSGIRGFPGSGPGGEQREKFWSKVSDFSRDLFVPLSVGGWIRCRAESCEDVQ